MARHIFFWFLNFSLICKWPCCGETFFPDSSLCIKISYSNFLCLSVNLVPFLTGKPHPILLKGCITGLEELEVSKCLQRRRGDGTFHSDDKTFFSLIHCWDFFNAWMFFSYLYNHILGKKSSCRVVYQILLEHIEWCYCFKLLCCEMVEVM